MESLGMKRNSPLIDKVTDPIFLRFWCLLDKGIEPTFTFGGALGIIQVSLQNRTNRHLSVYGIMDDRPRIECSDHAVDPSYLVGGNEVCLVEENHIGKVNLVGQQVHNGTFIGVPLLLVRGRRASRS